jgi:hypothetical protein
MFRNLLAWYRSRRPARGGTIVRFGLDANVRDGVFAVLVARTVEGRETAFSTKRLDVLTSNPLGWRCYRTGSMTATLTGPSGAVREIETLEF